MNNARNRQQRPPRNDRSQAPRPNAASVPNVQQVTRGATVSVILKEDQPTGREVQGTVAVLLTRGNHPRGIKVKLTDGRVGRVQRMVESTTPQPLVQQRAALSTTTNYRREGTSLPSTRDVRLDELDEPPVRTFFDFLPPEMQNELNPPTLHASDNLISSPSAKCPICDNFEGDEAAVSHHVEQHLR